MQRTSDGVPVGAPRYSDDALLEAWELWAHLEAPSHARPAWDERTYAYWRFVEGLGPVEAFAAARARELEGDGK